MQRVTQDICKEQFSCCCSDLAPHWHSWFLDICIMGVVRMEESVCKPVITLFRSGWTIWTKTHMKPGTPRSHSLGNAASSQLSRTFHWSQTHCHTVSETQQVSQLDSVFINTHVWVTCVSAPAGTSDDQTIMTTAGQFKFATLTTKNINVRQFSSWACCWMVLTFLPFMKPLILSWRLLSLLLLL